MGLFSSKTKINVFSNALQLADPDTNLIAETIIGSLLSGQEITDGLTHLAFNGISAKVDRMMNYARDSYTLGLPQGSISETTVLPEEDVIAAIEADVPLTWSCALDLNFVTPLNEGHLALPFLEKQRNFDIRTGLITEHPAGISYPTAPAPTPPGQEWLEDVYRIALNRVEYAQDLTTSVATLTIYYDLETTHYYQTRTYDFQDSMEPIFTYQQEVVEQEVSEEITVTTGAAGYRFGQSYLIAKYYKEIDGIGTLSDTADWWFYDIAAEKYAALNYTPDVDESNTLMPVVPMRFDNQDLCDVAHQSTDLYLTSKKLLKKIDVDIQDLRDAINENAQVADIDNAYVMFGINLRNPAPLSIRYLAEFFDYLADLAVIKQSNLIQSLISGLPINNNQYVFGDFTNPGGTTTEWTYGDFDYYGEPYQIDVVNTNNPISLEEQGLDMGIEYTDISSKMVVGVIGDVGFADIELTASSATLDYAAKDTLHPVDTSLVTLRHQVTPTRYKWIRVRGLTHYNRVYQDKTIWTTIDDILANPDDGADAEDGFIIPLHYGTVRILSPYERNYLYLESLHLVAHSIVKTTVKWYQSGVFKVICLLVAAIIFAYTGNPQFLYAVGTMFAMEIIGDIVPADILAILSVVYLAYQIYTFDFKLLFSGTATAETYMTAATMALKVAELPIQIRMRDLQGEFEDLAVQQELQAQELEDANKALDVSTDWLLSTLLNNSSFKPMFFAAPTDMFNQRIHNTNPGILALKQPEYFAANALLLPDNSFTG